MFFASHLAKKHDSFAFFLLNDVVLQCKKSSVSDRYTHRASMPLDGMSVEDLADAADNPVKAAWTITYNTEAAAAAAHADAPTTAATTMSATRQTATEDALQASPLAPLRPPSITAAPTSAAVASNGAGGVDSSVPYAPDRKTLTVYAASTEEKYMWLSDIMSLIEQAKKKSKTLMRQ
jgi:hypothetical protein